MANVEADATGNQRKTTFALDPGGETALAEITEQIGDSKTGAINRALKLYALLLHETQQREPKARKGQVVFYLTDPEDRDSTEKVFFS